MIAGTQLDLFNDYDHIIDVRQLDSITDPDVLRDLVKQLYTLLDDIDIISDIVEQKQNEKCNLGLSSDGYRLYYTEPPRVDLSKN